VKFYLAASFSARDEMRAMRDQIVSRGHEVTSRWIDLDLSIAGIDKPEENPIQARGAAMVDRTDITKSDILVLFTKTPSTTGAMHVELGIAIGMGIQAIVVGGRTNIFQVHPVIWHMKDEVAFLRYLDHIRRN